MVKDGRVLSLQSHVVSGYVGNKSATFPLQVLGLEVEAINSVQFSNHTGYKHVKGQIMDAEQLEELLEGLHSNNLSSNCYTHLLTGYVGSVTFLHKVCSVVSKLKETNPGLMYVCDPVMGDNGKMYVPPELLPIYREHVVPLADVITPNQYEAELLSGVTIHNETDAVNVMSWFHSRGVKTVVLSSTELGDEQHLVCLASTCMQDKTIQKYKVLMPKLPLSFTGTGDLFASLLLGWLHRTDHDVKASLENVVFSMQQVLSRTVAHARQCSSAGEVFGDRTVLPQHKELRLIQSLDDIRSPVPVIRVTQL